MEDPEVCLDCEVVMRCWCWDESSVETGREAQTEASAGGEEANGEELKFEGEGGEGEVFEVRKGCWVCG